MVYIKGVPQVGMQGEAIDPKVFSHVVPGDPWATMVNLLMKVSEQNAN